MDKISIAICKETVSQLPHVKYDGGIMVVDTMDTARMALRELSRSRVIGFDTETRPSFKKGRLHKAALMQLATDDFCFLFRLNKLGIFDSLKSFLEDPGVLKVGLSVHDDFNVLSRSCEMQPQGFIELQDFTKQYCIADNSLQKIFAIVFGQYISKSQRLTNWEAPELTTHQQQYAAIDAWACLKLYKYLNAGLFDPTASPYIIHKDEIAQEQEQI